MKSIVLNLFIILILFPTLAQSQSNCTPFYRFNGVGAVASAGDVNNDGFDDLIVGARGTVEGRVYVFSGLNGDTLFVFSGEAAGDLFGSAVASAGDVNNDGYDDLIVGAAGNDAAGSDAGRAYVFSGRNGDTLFVYSGERPGDQFGISVASAGDVNNDGHADLIVGALENGTICPGNCGGPGRAFVFSGLTGDTLHVFTGEVFGDLFGRKVASAGDVNNDGYDDLIIGAPLNDAGGNDTGQAHVYSGLEVDTTGKNAGRAYVFSGLNGDTLHVFTGEAFQDGLGGSVASAGDVNNDGFADLIVASTGNGAGGTRAGRVYVFSGRDGDTLHVFTGKEQDLLGWSVSSAGDVNSDGHDDLIVSLQVIASTNPLNAGLAIIFSGLTGDTLSVFEGENAGDWFGNVVASAGDINNDGLPDLIIGAPRNSAGGQFTGRAYVFLSGTSICGDANRDGLVTQDDLTFLIKFYFLAGESPGNCVASDVNGDGMFDLSDIVFLAEYLNGIGPAPCSASEPPPSFDPKKKPEGHKTGPTGF